MKWKKPEWEHIVANTCRMKVPGGWLISDSEGDSMALVFLPDPNHEWEWEVNKDERIHCPICKNFMTREGQTTFCESCGYIESK